MCLSHDAKLGLNSVAVINAGTIPQDHFVRQIPTMGPLVHLCTLAVVVWRAEWCWSHNGSYGFFLSH